MNNPGYQLETLCQQAKCELLLVAPFIKLQALKRLLESAAKDVSITCVTRWRPEEIASGVSDIEIWPFLQTRNQSSLWLRNDLHAKYYRADRHCLIGSANLTLTALGWTRNPNLELLIATAHDDMLIKFERELLEGCVEIDQDVFDRAKTMADALRSADFRPSVNTQQNLPQTESETSYPRMKREAWIPTLRSPEKLFVAYQGRFDDLTAAARESALSDLSFLDVPTGLSGEQFEQYVGTLLLQFPIIKQVDDYVSESQRFGAVVQLLASLPCAQMTSFDGDRAWQTLMRWLIAFLPTRYEHSIPRYSEVFRRV